MIKNSILAMQLLLASFVILSFVACDKEDPTTDLIITIQDLSGSALDGARVTLFPDKASWEEGSSQLHTSTTNSDGEVVFSDLEAEVYHIDATLGDLTNWSQVIATPILLPGQSNKLDIVIVNELSSKLVGKKEQSYELTDVILQGISILGEIDACERDNVTFFQRDEQLGAIELGQELCPEETAGLQLFQWTINPDQNVINILFESGDQAVYRLISFEGQKMLLETTIDIAGQQVAIETEFTKIEDLKIEL